MIPGFQNETVTENVPKMRIPVFNAPTLGALDNGEAFVQNFSSSNKTIFYYFCQLSLISFNLPPKPLTSLSVINISISLIF